MKDFLRKLSFAFKNVSDSVERIGIMFTCTSQLQMQKQNYKLGMQLLKL